MANHFRETAERLREIAASAAHLSAEQQETLEVAARAMLRLSLLRNDLLVTAINDSDGGDNLAADLMSLLDLHSGS